MNGVAARHGRILVIVIVTIATLAVLSSSTVPLSKC